MNVTSNIWLVNLTKVTYLTTCQMGHPMKMGWKMTSLVKISKDSINKKCHYLYGHYPSYVLLFEPPYLPINELASCKATCSLKTK
jgi:hypothetical protein